MVDIDYLKILDSGGSVLKEYHFLAGVAMEVTGTYNDYGLVATYSLDNATYMHGKRSWRVSGAQARTWSLSRRLAAMLSTRLGTGRQARRGECASASITNLTA